MTRRTWEPEEDDYLRRLWPNRNISVESIATHLGRHRTSISAHALRIGLKPRRAPDWDSQMLNDVQRSTDGVIKRLARKHNRTEVAVANRVARAAMRLRA